MKDKSRQTESIWKETNKNRKKGEKIRKKTGSQE